MAIDPSRDINITQVCVRDINKKRSFELEKHTTMVTDYDGEMPVFHESTSMRLFFVRFFFVGRPEDFEGLHPGV